MSETKTKTPLDVNVRLDPELRNFIDNERARDKESVSVIVRRALRQYKKRQEAKTESEK